jgi:hypothetical protein
VARRALPLKTRPVNLPDWMRLKIHPISLRAQLSIGTVTDS